MGAVSCSDMLETESTRQSFDPNMDSKTDSVTYAFGILKGMQQLADQYFFIGEMRGDLVSTTLHTDNNLRQLADFTADCSNKYDSAYVYYTVINNCNYYLSHRDTTLYTGSQNMVINEYVAIAALRAWTYLQLTKTYERVPYFTEVVKEISQIDNNNYPELNTAQVVDSLAPQLLELINRYDENYLKVPDFSKNGNTALTMGSTNFGVAKYINPEHLFVPIRVVLGDMYLETGKYEDAAKQYFEYINYSAANQMKSLVANYMDRDYEYPTDYSQMNVGNYFNTWGANPMDWSSIFNGGANPTDVVTYIPMAVTKLLGTTSDIPEAFGYSYYATGANTRTAPKNMEVQIIPSQEYYNLAKNSSYYYRSVPIGSTSTTTNIIKPMNSGDARLTVLERQEETDTTYTWISKNANATIYLYRNTTVYMHLAEALNRMGYYDAAFCILKDGISTRMSTLIDTLKNQTNTYISPATSEYLRTELPFLSEENVEKYSQLTVGGIHQHGAGICIGIHTPYQMKAVIGAKMKEISDKFSLNITNPTKQDTINAMEDILCDEYALEFAFEGTRFYDLCRLAKHKNEASYRSRSSFGDLWLSEKLKKNRVGVTTKNCFLPFK